MLRPRLIVAVVAALLLLVPAAFAAFPDDEPNDPGYNPDSPECIDAKQYELFGFRPDCTPAAPADDPSGMSIDDAWKRFTTGNAETVIAYVEAGINWHDPDDARELANKVFLNAGELPDPTTDDGDPALRASDFADTADANGNGLVDGEDVTLRFSDGRDDDANGYVDDVSGWNFYDDDNDPATVDSAYHHANTQMERAGGETDNGLQRAGVCPKCRVLPIKAGAEALDRTDDLAEAWLYAVDAGASVVVSVTADLGYSSFMRQAAEEVAHRGAIAVQASNDFDSTDHQGGMWWPHVLPGNGMVADRQGFGPASTTTTTYRERSTITSWGAHNVFTVATSSGTTSASTPTLGGVMAMVMAYGRERLAKPLTGLEAVQVVRDTASDVHGDYQWPTKPGWDVQYGYGRPDVPKAMEAIDAGRIPPVAAIESPGWFSLYDPARERTVPVSGLVDASRAGGAYTWRLEAGLGPEPDEFREVASGSGTGRHEGRLGELDLGSIPREHFAKAFTLSERKQLETSEQYVVTLRLRVTDAAGVMGEDRRAVNVHHDPSAVAGFPRRIGAATSGGESQPALVDLQGRGQLDLVFGDTDGRVHALDWRTGAERPGWPVRTEPTRVTMAHDGVDPGHEPVIANVAVGDLDGTGALSVVATTSTGRTYAWHADGRRRAGWPRTLDTGVEAPPRPRNAQPRTRLRHRGAFAAPVLYDLDGDDRLEVVQAGWDGHLHAFRGDGAELPGWPVKVEEPATGPGPGRVRVHDRKLSATPAIADLDGDGKPEVVIRSQYTDIGTPVPDPQLAARGWLHAYGADGKPREGFPTELPGVAEAYGSAQEFITEGSNSPVAADVDGDGDDEVVTNAVLSPSVMIDGDGSLRQVFAPLPDPTLGALRGDLDPQDVLERDLPADVPVGFTTSAAFGRFAGGLTFAQPGSGGASIGGALGFPGAGLAINNYERAFDARTGAARPGFPAETQGLNFVGAPIVADVTGDGEAEIVDGGDSNALHAFAAGGAQAAGFPKFNSGWALWAPSAGDLDGDGKVEIVQATREGYLFAWRTEGRADANGEWWRWHHDEWSTGRYGTDTRPPGAVRDVRDGQRPGTVSFVAPGDEWYGGGKVAGYRVTAGGARAAARAARRARARRQDGVTPATANAGGRETVAVPGGARSVTVQAVDDAGNLGTPVTYALGPKTPTGIRPVADDTPDDTGASAPRAAPSAPDDDGGLPFTGVALIGIALLGVSLLALGVLGWRQTSG